jgi:hypothetical protein
MELAASDPSMESPSGGDQPPRLVPAARASSAGGGPEPAEANASGGGPGDAGKVVDALKASADTEFQIAERLASKARQAYALAAGVFVVSQTVAFGSFQAAKLSSREQHVLIGCAIVAVVMLAVATWRVLAADDVQPSGDLPLDALMDDLNAAYEGDDEVLGRLGGYYAGVVRSRRNANAVRRSAYKSSRIFVAASLAATIVELVFALIARTT